MTERDTDGADRSGTPADAREPAGPVESADPADDATGELTEAQLLAEIDAELAAEIAARPRAGTMLVGTVLLIGALVGWIASLNLTVDKMYLLEHPDAELACEDRKSTRLNSSHVASSYAVFCLNQKTIHMQKS